MIDMEQVMQFTAPSGKSFVYLAALPYAGKLLYSPNGELFYTLALRNLRGTAEEHQYSFDDVHGVMGEDHFRRAGDLIHYDGEQYTLQAMASFDASSIIPLPDIRCSRYLCSNGNMLYYLSRSRYHVGDEFLKLFIGDGTTMRQIPIREVRFVTDEDDFYADDDQRVFTAEGWFSFSDLGESNYSSSSEGLLDNLNPDDYVIVEANGQVTITKK